jgi:hypothetical protein
VTVRASQQHAFIRALAEGRESKVRAISHRE